MKRIFNGIAKMLVAVVLCLVYMWFVLSFALSPDEMSVSEKVLGVAYYLLMLPIYKGIKRLVGLK